MVSDMEKMWKEHYFQCWNATEAARRTGYKWPNKVGPAKLKKFRDEIQERLDEQVMAADEVLRRLSQIARGEFAYYITEQGTVDIERMVKEGKAHLITGLRETKYGKQIDFVDMQNALEKLGRAHALFKSVHTGPDGGPVQINVVDTNVGDDEI